MLKCRVKWWDDAKGFGFLIDSDGRDVFVHYSNIQMPGRRSLLEGQMVEYDAAMGPKGLHATTVVPPGF